MRKFSCVTNARIFLCSIALLFFAAHTSFATELTLEEAIELVTPLEGPYAEHAEWAFLSEGDEIKADFDTIYPKNLGEMDHSYIRNRALQIDSEVPSDEVQYGAEVAVFIDAGSMLTVPIAKELVQYLGYQPIWKIGNLYHPNGQPSVNQEIGYVKQYADVFRSFRERAVGKSTLLQTAPPVFILKSSRSSNVGLDRLQDCTVSPYTASDFPTAQELTERGILHVVVIKSDEDSTDPYPKEMPEDRWEVLREVRFSRPVESQKDSGLFSQVMSVYKEAGIKIYTQNIVTPLLRNFLG